MNEAETVQALAEGGGTTISGIVGFILWKMLQAMQKSAEAASESLNHQKRHGQAAERHYEREEELYRSIQEQHRVREATADMRAENEREMIRLRAKVDSLERRTNTGNTGPIRITDDEDTG